METLRHNGSRCAQPVVAQPTYVLHRVRADGESDSEWGGGGSGDGEEDDGEAGGVAAAPDGELAPSAHKSRLGFGMAAGPAQQRGRRLDRGQ
jgi:hypothetical protein